MYEDDITYCSAQNGCQNTSCFRHPSHINWNTPKHSILGASMADFSPLCPAYERDDMPENTNDVPEKDTDRY